METIGTPKETHRKTTEYYLALQTPSDTVGCDTVSSDTAGPDVKELKDLVNIEELKARRRRSVHNAMPPPGAILDQGIKNKADTGHAGHRAYWHTGQRRRASCHTVWRRASCHTVWPDNVASFWTSI